MSAARTPVSLSLMGVLVACLPFCSRGYFTLNVRHVVVAAVCAAVLAIVARMR